MKKILQIQQSEENRNSQISAALSRVPAEPADGPDVVTIRLRLPTDVSLSSMVTRRFLYSHTLAQLVAHVESLGFLRTEFRLLMTYPRTDVGLRARLVAW